MAGEETQHGIAVQNHSPPDTRMADHASPETHTVPEDEAVPSVSDATTPPKSFFKKLFNWFRNDSSDHVDVNAHVGDNDYCAKPKSSCGQYPSNEDTTEQPASV